MRKDRLDKQIEKIKLARMKPEEQKLYNLKKEFKYILDEVEKLGGEITNQCTIKINKKPNILKRIFIKLKKKSHN